MGLLVSESEHDITASNEEVCALGQPEQRYAQINIEYFKKTLMNVSPVPCSDSFSSSRSCTSIQTMNESVTLAVRPE